MARLLDPFVTLLFFTSLYCLVSLSPANYSTLLTCYTTSELHPSAINPQLCTHLLLIGACGLHDNVTVALPSDKFVRRYVRLKRKNPALKVLITLGPKNAVMSRLVLSEELRQQFIGDVIAFMQRNELDGFDFDWEFPGWMPMGGQATDRNGFSLLLNETRAAFHRDIKHKYLLFVTVAAPYTIVDVAYDIPAINDYADYVQIMNYDFHVYSRAIPFTGFNAPLRAEEFEISVLGRMNSDYSTQYWLRHGLDAKKLIFGIPTYGRGFQLSSPSVHELYAPAVGYSSYGESVPYSTVCVILRDAGSNIGHEWSRRAASTFLYSGTDWITYENEKSVRMKARYALGLNVAGLMVYALQTDDYAGVCNERVRRMFPLTQSIRDEILRFHNSSNVVFI